MAKLLSRTERGVIARRAGEIGLAKFGISRDLPLSTEQAACT